MFDGVEFVYSCGGRGSKDLGNGRVMGAAEPAT
jgi:hypothetical protein